MNTKESRQANLAGRWLFLLFVVGYAVFLSTRIANIAGGADPASYMELNRMMMNGSFEVEMRQAGSLPLEALPRNAYVSIGLREATEGYIQGPTAFPGYPLIISVMDALLPQKWAVWFSIFLISIGICLVTYLLIRIHGLSSGWGLFGSAAIVMSPLAAIIGVMPMADFLSCLLGLACWLLSRSAHQGKWFALWLGVCLGLAVITRPNNVVMFVPVVVTLLFNLKRQKWWWMIGVGGAPFAGFLFWFNKVVYGSPFASDYDRHKSDFGIEHVWPTLEQFSIWMWDSMIPVAFVLLPFSLVFIKGRIREVVTLWVWILAIFALPLFFSESRGQYWNLRYTLPAWPAILLGASIGGTGLIHFLARVWNRGPWLHWLAIPLAIGAALFGVIRSNGMHLYDFKKNELAHFEMAEWINANTEANDVVLAFQTSGSIQYYSDRSFLRWDRLKQEHWKLVKANAAREGYQILANIFVHEFKDAESLSQRFPGTWESRATFGAFTVYELLMD